MCISTVYSVSKLIFFISEIRALRFFFLGGLPSPFLTMKLPWCPQQVDVVHLPALLVFGFGCPNSNRASVSLGHFGAYEYSCRGPEKSDMSSDWIHGEQKEIKDMIPLLEFKKCLIISWLTCHLRSCSWSPSEAWNAWVVYIVSCMSWHYWHSLHSCHPQLHACHFPYGSALPLEAALSTKPKDSRVDWWHIIEHK